MSQCLYFISNLLCLALIRGAGVHSVRLHHLCNRAAWRNKIDARLPSFLHFFNAHTYCWPVGSWYTVSHSPMMPHNIIINAKTMYDSYMHECEHTGDRFLFLFHFFCSSSLGKAHAEHYAHIIPMAMVTDMRNGERLYGVEHVSYAWCGCVCVSEWWKRNSTTMEISFSKHKSNLEICVRIGNDSKWKWGPLQPFDI